MGFSILKIQVEYYVIIELEILRLWRILTK